MKCPRCKRELVEQIVPSYLGHIYYCEKCKKDYFFRQVVTRCPECGKTRMKPHELLENWEDRSIEEICEDCEVKDEM